jgi:hypothetical protein
VIPLAIFNFKIQFNKKSEAPQILSATFQFVGDSAVIFNLSFQFNQKLSETL